MPWAPIAVRHHAAINQKRTICFAGRGSVPVSYFNIAVAIASGCNDEQAREVHCLHICRNSRDTHRVLQSALLSPFGAYGPTAYGPAAVRWARLRVRIGRRPPLRAPCRGPIHVRRAASGAILRPASWPIFRPASRTILRAASGAIFRAASGAILRSASRAILRRQSQRPCRCVDAAQEMLPSIRPLLR